jgi:hypothetical protein
MNPTRSLRILVPLALLASVALVPGPAPAASSCKKLTVTDGLRADLKEAHARLTDRPFAGPKRVRYGRCGTKYYALASFKDKELGYQDQPEHFTRSAGHGWKDRGDTGGDPCGTAPDAMLRAWGIDC